MSDNGENQLFDLHLISVIWIGLIVEVLTISLLIVLIVLFVLSQHDVMRSY